MHIRISILKPFIFFKSAQIHLYENYNTIEDIESLYSKILLDGLSKTNALVI